VWRVKINNVGSVLRRPFYYLSLQYEVMFYNGLIRSPHPELCTPILSYKFIPKHLVTKPV